LKQSDGDYRADGIAGFMLRSAASLSFAISATRRIADGSVWLLLEALTEAREAASSKAVTTASTPALPV
jgi:hypothetical protein